MSHRRLLSQVERRSGRSGLGSERDEAGATAVEYALMAGFIAAVVVTGVAAFGAAVLRMFLMGAALFP